jgi:diguanylate cyclase (GGDEF)-like protein
MPTGCLALRQGLTVEVRGMARAITNLIGRLGAAAGGLLARLDMLALFPILALAGLALDLQSLVMFAAFALITLLVLRTIGAPRSGAGVAEAGPRGGLRLRSAQAGREAILAALDRVARVPDHDSACILVQVDGWDRLTDLWGAEMTEEVMQRCGDRMRSSLRDDDLVTRLADARFGVVLHPIRAARLGPRDAIARRLSDVIAEALVINGAAVRLTASAGHSELRREAANIAAATLSAAEAALAEASRHGPNAVRAYTPGLLRTRRARTDLARDVEAALEDGQIVPWFQPQIRSATGVISGFEALARWTHPDRGLLSPAEFLAAIDDAGKMGALGRHVLFHALSALKSWDEAGLRVPTVSVNVSAIELRDPTLADRIRSEIDRFDLQPGRLTVEILETVAASGEDDAILATLSALRSHGIGIDLDDFGIGQASLAAIRRFGVNRIKIDRSFVLGLDTDAEKQAMVAAILSMADHLGVETLAEGVETRAVEALLTRMGCGHLQGYLHARPMPVEQTLAWATRHNDGIARLPVLDRHAG